MENASKALLIAAAVLIVILLVAFGMRIFNSTSNVSEDATEVGTSVSDHVADAAESATASIADASVLMDGYRVYRYNFGELSTDKDLNPKSTNIKIHKNGEYTFSFDYKITQIDEYQRLFCETGAIYYNGTKKKYIPLATLVEYNKEGLQEGHVENTVRVNSLTHDYANDARKKMDEGNDLYIALVFLSRSGLPDNQIKVKISNFQIKYK